MTPLERARQNEGKIYYCDECDNWWKSEARFIVKKAEKLSCLCSWNVGKVTVHHSDAA